MEYCLLSELLTNQEWWQDLDLSETWNTTVWHWHYPLDDRWHWASLPEHHAVSTLGWQYVNMVYLRPSEKCSSWKQHSCQSRYSQIQSSPFKSTLKHISPDPKYFKIRLSITFEGLNSFPSELREVRHFFRIPSVPQLKQSMRLWFAHFKMIGNNTPADDKWKHTASIRDTDASIRVRIVFLGMDLVQLQP